MCSSPTFALLVRPRREKWKRETAQKIKETKIQMMKLTDNQVRCPSRTEGTWSVWAVRALPSLASTT